MTNKDTKKKGKAQVEVKSDNLWAMSCAPKVGESVHWFQLLPIAFFGAVIIMLTQMHSYERPQMADFYWSGGGTSLMDFFSYCKMTAILICAALALVLLCYRFFCQSFYIKRSFAYIPMLVYSAFVLISYFASDYKDFALLGYNDRFEGTLTLLAYMVMLFFIINSVNNEKSMKWVIYPIGVTSAILGLLGVTQALDKDFFRTGLGQKLITPNGTIAMDDAFLNDAVGKALNEAGLIQQSTYTVNEIIDMCESIGIDFLSFTFQNKEIYQTVYNINYVSFYLTLLVPLFGMLFIRSVLRGKEEVIWKKIMWGALFGLLVFNLIGSASSGGWLGMFAVVVAALIILNKKVLNWWKPVAILLVCAIVIGGATFDRWAGELTNAIDKTVTTDADRASASEEENPYIQHHLQYIDTTGNDIVIGIDDNTMTITTFPEDPNLIQILDQNGKSIELIPTETDSVLAFNDDRFVDCFLQPAQDTVGGNYLIFTSDHQKQNWTFKLTDAGVLYYSDFGQLIDLDIVPAIGFEDNQGFGSGRGYIFSRTFPMMKDTFLIGHGADTYVLHFPHYDYVGKYNSPNYSGNINIIVDKPHNMYMGMWIGTGGISTLAFLALVGIYLAQSFKLFFRNRFDKDDFAAFASAGIFFGIIGFLVAGLVNDSTVSVMPMFYTLLGTGIAANMFLKKRELKK